MALDVGEQVLILLSEYEPSPGWIFAAGTSEAGYVPRTYLAVDLDIGSAE